MNDPIIRIRSLYPSFSKSSKTLADFIIEKWMDIPFLSVRELADLSGVSVASISRFVREAGFTDFKAFKKHLGPGSRSSVGSIYQPAQADDSPEAIVEKVFSGNLKSIAETLDILDRAEIIRAARLIADTSRLVFFGMGSSGNFALDAALRFSQISVPAEAYLDSYQILTQAMRMKKGQVAFGISHSGRSALTVRALELASKNGATTIGLSNFMRSPLHKVSDIFFCTIFPASRILTAALSPAAAQMCILDALYLLTASRSKKWLTQSERLNRESEKLLCLPQNGKNQWRPTGTPKALGCGSEWNKCKRKNGSPKANNM